MVNMPFEWDGAVNSTKGSATFALFDKELIIEDIEFSTAYKINKFIEIVYGKGLNDGKERLIDQLTKASLS